MLQQQKEQTLVVKINLRVDGPGKPMLPSVPTFSACKRFDVWNKILKKQQHIIDNIVSVGIYHLTLSVLDWIQQQKKTQTFVIKINGRVDQSIVAIKR